VKANRQILLYGNSVILGSISASLRRCSQFEVTTLASPLQNSQWFDTVKPDIVLFDLEAPQTEAPFFLLKTHPALVLIGISPGTNLVRVWNNQQLQDISMQGLLELINSETMGVPAALVEPAVVKENGSGQKFKRLQMEVGK
jgi:hypothetical protein